jgi:antitoxin component YwqK of YwqJK toxin-antitoxin module
MKRIYLVFLLVAIFGCTDQQVSDTSVSGNFADLPEAAVKEPYPDNDRLVRVSVYGANGNVLQQGDYFDGVRTGVWTEYHPNGLVKLVTGYVNGVMQGQQLELDNRGQLLARSTFYHGLLHGEYVKYNRTRIKEKKTYVNGKLNGLTEIFYANGVLMEQSNYIDGLRDGIAKWYDQQGNVTIEYVYEKGEWLKDEE